MTQEAYAIAAAFYKGKPCRRKRTMTNGDAVWLFGNRIAWKDDDGTLWLSMCGWGTTTTRDRLNAITEVFDLGRMFYQHKGEQFYGDKTIGTSIAFPAVGPLAMQAIMAEQRLAA